MINEDAVIEELPIGKKLEDDAHEAERQVHNWKITDLGEGNISAVNNVTKKEFSGPAVDFNATYLN